MTQINLIRQVSESFNFISQRKKKKKQFYICHVNVIVAFSSWLKYLNFWEGLVSLMACGKGKLQNKHNP